MAEQPNITSILAALAAQRPAGAPTQAAYQTPPATQAALSAAYPTSASTSTPPTSLGGFQLPQPSHSGSVDLSSIKPVSSGTVSITDAIQKARGIAAERGVPYESRGAPTRDSDPRAGVRQFGRSRSRSRSPPPARRENFRDNYNPYRDERREDRRGVAGRDYPRDQSFSPGPRERRRPGNTLSPPPSRGYGARDDKTSAHGAGGDDHTETINIDSSIVGLIIGRQGENLKRVESETGARVQFVPGDGGPGATRECKISGTRQARNAAKDEIYRVINENSRPSVMPFDRGERDAAVRAASGAAPGGHQPALRDGEDSTQIMVPDRTVGLIIGRGGETIRDLQERSGCHVNIVGEQKSVNGLRPVNLIGTVAAAAMAKDLIMEIVDSDTKSLANQGPPARAVNPAGFSGGAGYGGAGAGAGAGAGDRMNDSIYVPSEAVGMIIGKGGETIKDMQNTTGCKINVSQPSGSGELQREIGLVGSRDAIEQAKMAIEEKVEVVKRAGRSQRDDSYTDRYSHQQPRQQQPQQPYGQNASGAHGQAPQGQAAPAQGGEADPYAAYGGYQNYVAMWYAAMARQQQQGQGPGEQQGPPGTA